MATAIGVDEPGKVVYELRGSTPGQLGYEVQADLSNYPKPGDEQGPIITRQVLMWASITDLEPTPSGRVRPRITAYVPTFSRDTLDSLANALDQGKSIKVTVEWE